MPSMIRPKGKARKIAYSILGVPANIAYKPTESQKKVNETLVFDETIRVR